MSPSHNKLLKEHPHTECSPTSATKNSDYSRRLLRFVRPLACCFRSLNTQSANFVKNISKMAGPAVATIFSTTLYLLISQCPSCVRNTPLAGPTIHHTNTLAHLGHSTPLSAVIATISKPSCWMTPPAKTRPSYAILRQLQAARLFDTPHKSSAGLRRLSPQTGFQGSPV